jgi:Asp-tRNA(Asn)/Glu-tRNA(Gln) amidotransferase B subunit
LASLVSVALRSTCQRGSAVRLFRRQVMKAAQGKANPAQVNELLKKKLSA